MKDSLRAQVRVPATIANLGPGFDALGLAMGLWLEASAQIADADRFHYEGDGLIADTPQNMIHQGFRAAFRAIGLEAPHAVIRARNPIPLARGLGSSSAALVAGAALADVMLEGRLGREGVLRVCAELEGHPDNVAPAVLGGFTASAMNDSGPVSVSLPLPADWHILVAVPERELLTSKARGALPDSYSRADAVFNLSRAALWVAGIASGRYEVLREACRDAIHQPYRSALIPGLQDAIDGAINAGALAAFLSGAGPSVAAIALEPEPVVRALSGYSPRVLPLRPATGYETSLEEASVPMSEAFRGR
jgi:homoserine kinase